MKKWVVLIAAVLVAGLVVATSARSQRGIEFGRAQGFASDGTRTGTAFQGKCDDYDAPDTYRGVTLSFPQAHMTVQADEMTWQDHSNELVFKGTVRIALDGR